jgi:lipoprotein-releasing system permease protein
MFQAWLVYRFVTSGRGLLNLPSVMSLLGMTLGVASLVVAMGVISGFENTLREAVTDVFGHVLVIRQNQDSTANAATLISQVKHLSPHVQFATPFVQFEGVLAHNQKISGVLIQGLDLNTVDHVLRMRNRVISGEFSFAPKDEAAGVLIGKALQKRFDLKLGDVFRIVLPSPSRESSTQFKPKVRSFVLRGVLDLGKNDYDERYIVTDIRTAQDFADLGDGFSGLRLRLDDEKLAPQVSSLLAQSLGHGFWTMDWIEVNRNLFEAVRIERQVIFFVLLIMVIAASFNISSNLFVSVLQKFSDISVLKAMGCSSRDILRVFTLQGLFFGAVGTGIGLILGFILCLAFLLIQKIWVILPADIYKLDHIGLEIRWVDLLSIVGSAFFICLISTLTPAWRGSKLNPVEGIRYE